MFSESWRHTHNCEICKEGFGDLEGESVRKVMDGFGDSQELIFCPRCGALLVREFGQCHPPSKDDHEFWGYSKEDYQKLIDEHPGRKKND